jgi:hypothetical protein
MVWVLPDPVYPYAIITPLNPSSTSYTIGLATTSYVSACDDIGLNTLSKKKSL